MMGISMLSISIGSVTERSEYCRSFSFVYENSFFIYSGNRQWNSNHISIRVQFTLDLVIIEINQQFAVLHN